MRKAEKPVAAFWLLSVCIRVNLWLIQTFTAPSRLRFEYRGRGAAC